MMVLLVQAALLRS